jgi:cysteine desulfurase
MARDARRAVDEARDVVADCLGCAPGDVVFTGSGTEADNAAIAGVSGTALCSAIEHHAVLHAVERAEGRVIGVDAGGRIDLDELAVALSSDVGVVSVMLANNEVGVVQPLNRVTRLVSKGAPQAYVHTDAVQAFPWLDVASLTRHAQLVAVSAHKFGGPKGVGALVVRAGAALEPLLVGGGQERDRRSGTHNVAGIVAMATAMRVTVDTREQTVARIGALRDRLVDQLIANVPGLHETVARETKVAGSAHVCVEGVENEALLFLLARAGICASAASACASGALAASHVLAAMGVPKELAGGSLRLSLGWTSSDDDVDHIVEVLPAAVRRLRGES